MIQIPRPFDTSYFSRPAVGRLNSNGIYSKSNSLTNMLPTASDIRNCCAIIFSWLIGPLVYAQSDFQWPVNNPAIHQQYGARDDAGLSGANYRGGKNNHTGVDLSGNDGSGRAYTLVRAIQGSASAKTTVEAIYGLAGGPNGATQEQIPLWNGNKTDAFYVAGQAVGTPSYTPSSSNVLCPATGNSRSNFIGVSIVLKHANGLYSFYGHMRAIRKDIWDRKKAGEVVEVEKGEPLGLMGGSGINNEKGGSVLDAFPIHVHFEIKKHAGQGDKEINPQYWGYTPGHPELYGYVEPWQLMGPFTPEFTLPTVVSSVSAEAPILNAPVDSYAGQAPSTISVMGPGQKFVATRMSMTNGKTWYFVDFPSSNSSVYGPTGGWVSGVATDTTAIRVAVGNTASSGEAIRQDPVDGAFVYGRVFSGQYLVLADPVPLNPNGETWLRVYLPKRNLTPTQDEIPARTGWIRSATVQILGAGANLQCVAKETGTPVAGATIKVGDTTLGTTDASGRASIPANLIGDGIITLIKDFQNFTGLVKVASAAQLASAEVIEMESSASPAASTRFAIGDEIEVFGTGIGLRGRYPDPASTTYVVLDDGTQGHVIDGPQASGGYNRWRIRFDARGMDLWCAEGEPDGNEFYLRRATAPIVDNLEPNNSSTSATPISAGTSIQSYVSSPADMDWFFITVATPSVITINLTVPLGLDYDLELYGPNATWVTGSYGTTGLSEAIIYTASTPGTYWLRVYGYPAGSGSFSNSQPYTISTIIGVGVFTYTTYESSISITGYTSKPIGDLIIPSTIDGKPVTSIGTRAFSQCSGLTSVTIPSSVINIWNYSFYQCSSLTNVIIPNSVTTIGSYAFSQCSGMANVTIPSSVTSLGSDAFSNCSGLTSVNIPNSVTSIGSYAFNHCSSLTSVTIPSSLISISRYAFGSCSSLTEVTIPVSVTIINDYAFFRCSSLDYVTIPDSVTSIGRWAFAECDILTSVLIPDSVTSIGGGAFSHCSGLTSVTIPSSVTSIGSSAFWGCRSLINVTIPNSVTSIGSSSFAVCNKLIAITVDASNTNFISVDGVLFNNGKTELIQCPAGKTGSYAIPASVTNIGTDAFCGCGGLTSVAIPASVTSIQYRAFGWCGLTSLTIPNSVTSIAAWTFAGCSGLTSVAIPNSVISIGEHAFYDCSGLTSVAIPNSVISIGEYAFCGCKLTSVTIPSKITRISSWTFWGCRLTSVTIPSGITRIDTQAFSYCTALTSVSFVGNAPTIETNAFYNVASAFKIYYFDEKSGFSAPTWNGYPAVNMGLATPGAIWLLEKGLSYDTDLQSDPNGDGVNILMAYALNLDPKKNLSGSMPKPVCAGNQMSLTFYAGGEGVAYAVESSIDLQHWNTDGISITEADANSLRTATVDLNGPRRFMRLAVAY